MKYNIRPADMSAYHSLKHFHYVGSDPAVPNRVFAAYVGAFCTPVAVLVEAYPVLQAAARNIALPDRYNARKGYAVHRLNAEMRTIARVIVHPQHRGNGLAEELVKTLIDHASTPLLEVFSAQPHKFFQNAGMIPLRTREALTLETFYYLWSALPMHPPLPRE